MMFALGLVLVGCKSDDDGNDLTNAQACANIIEACHPKDDGSDPVINGCHEKAHDGGDCLSDYDMCIMACNEAPAITDSHGHETDGHGTHGSGTHGGTHGTHGSGTHGGTHGTHGSGTHGTHGSDTGTGGSAGTGGVGHHVGPRR
ncbi:MAG: hypothetical protein D6705_10320 [Deltaproteobacteria bacterium]|nr:MAG: hypothetical protein D6705_10320 [Deltaproteobacteria bacterium]